MAIFRLAANKLRSMIEPYRIFFCRTFSPLFFIHSNPQRCADLQPACTGLTSYGAFSPFCPFRAGYSIGLTALLPCRADISFWLTAPFALAGQFILSGLQPSGFYMLQSPRFPPSPACPPQPWHRRKAMADKAWRVTA